MKSLLRALLQITLILLIMGISCPKSSAQGDWKTILDRYEAICNECIELKIRADAGEKVSSSKISSLLNRLTTMRRQLREGVSAMSREERARFDAIRARYYAVFYPNAVPQKSTQEESSATQKITAKVVKEANWQQREEPRREKSAEKESVAKAEAPPKVTRLDLHTINLPLPDLDLGRLKATLPESLSAPIAVRKESRQSLSQSISAARAPRRLWYGVMFCASVTPNLSYGARLSISGRESGWGGYVKFRSNFTTASTSYQCSSDGKIESGGAIWASGNTQHSLTLFSAGGRGRLFKGSIAEIGLSAGVGYGKYITAWEDISNNWAKVSDYSANGPLLEAGVYVAVGMFELHIGGSTTSFKYHELELGVGIRF